MFKFNSLNIFKVFFTFFYKTSQSLVLIFLIRAFYAADLGIYKHL